MTKYIFYKISCLDTSIDYVYIGSTTNFTKRKYHHKSRCNNINDSFHNFPVYKFIRDNGGFENFSMIPIEESDFETKLQARIREQELIETYINKLNSRNAYINKIEYKKQYNKHYRFENKEQIKKYKAQYFEQNKQHIKEYQKNYRLIKKLEKQSEIQPQFDAIVNLIEE